MDKKYETGYGKPPEEHQFKPGESGNKKGRPKGSKNTYALLNEILDQRIALKENNQTLKISKRIAILMQLVNKSVKGDARAMSVLFPHILMADMKEDERNKVLAALNTDDQTIINTYLSRFDGLETIRENEEGGEHDEHER